MVAFCDQHPHFMSREKSLLKSQPSIPLPPTYEISFMKMHQVVLFFRQACLLVLHQHDIKTNLPVLMSIDRMLEDFIVHTCKYKYIILKHILQTSIQVP